MYVTCGQGLAGLLAAELEALGLPEVRVAGSGVNVAGSLSDAYLACLHSRVANRVLWPLHRGPASDADALYRTVRKVDWSQHFESTQTFAVDCLLAYSNLNHSHYAALKVKDAIVDQFRERTGVRPSVDIRDPDLRINVYVFRNQARIAIDLSGASLHRRGWRGETGPAPLKENLAAALLIAAGWPERAEAGGVLLDPMCGSGTFLIEAAAMAERRAPGLWRERFGFQGWKGHEPERWQTMLEEARANVQSPSVLLMGLDRDRRVLEQARLHVKASGVKNVELHHQPLISAPPLPVGSGAKVLMISNPPFGERMGLDPDLYRQLGRYAALHCGGGRCALIATQQKSLRELRLPLESTFEFSNGGIDCLLGIAPVPTLRGAEQKAGAVPADHRSGGSAGEPVAPSDPGRAPGLRVDQSGFVNRLNKNLRSLKGWRKSNDIKAFRLYDADLPDFNFAIDVYDCTPRQVMVQEYEAPRELNPVTVDARRETVMSLLPQLLDVRHEQLHYRLRKRQRGTEQYQPHTEGGQVCTLEEAGARYELNFRDYLDTGLFLDHRKVRRWIGAHAEGKRFLNLFAYTATATVQAALGGARDSDSVDLSRTYTTWARRNLIANHLDTEQHRLVQADVMAWLGEEVDRVRAGGETRDLIFLDPPTFSNSARAEQDWDVQRDHEQIIRQCIHLLAPGGLLIFSNNFRRFRLEPEIAAGLNGQVRVEDRTDWSIDRDFARSGKIHTCLFIHRLAS